jgi:hypothetical protein
LVVVYLYGDIKIPIQVTIQLFVYNLNRLNIYANSGVLTLVHATSNWCRVRQLDPTY